MSANPRRSVCTLSGGRGAAQTTASEPGATTAHGSGDLLLVAKRRNDLRHGARRRRAELGAAVSPHAELARRDLVLIELVVVVRARHLARVPDEATMPRTARSRTRCRRSIRNRGVGCRGGSEGGPRCGTSGETRGRDGRPRRRWQLAAAATSPEARPAHCSTWSRQRAGQTCVVCGRAAAFRSSVGAGLAVVLRLADSAAPSGAIVGALVDALLDGRRDGEPWRDAVVDGVVAGGVVCARRGLGDALCEAVVVGVVAGRVVARCGRAGGPGGAVVVGVVAGRVIEAGGGRTTPAGAWAVRSSPALWAAGSSLPCPARAAVAVPANVSRSAAPRVRSQKVVWLVEIILSSESSVCSGEGGCSSNSTLAPGRSERQGDLGRSGGRDARRTAARAVRRGRAARASRAPPGRSAARG